MNLNLKKPCANCPFLKEGGIELHSGRLAGIVENLISDDGINFQCHKTVHSAQGGEWIDDDNGEERYIESGKESMCIGSAIFMLKIGRPTVSLRFALLAKMISLNELTSQNDIIKEASDFPTLTI